MIVVVGSVVGTALAAIIGPAIGRMLFGVNFTISGPGLGALTAGVCLVVIALTFAQALIALRHYAISAFAWVAGVAVFVGLMVMMDVDVFTRAEVAFVAGSTIAVMWMAVGVWISLRGIDGRAHQHYPVPLDATVDH